MIGNQPMRDPMGTKEYPQRVNADGRRGTTLLEVIIYIGIVSFVLLGVTAFAMDFMAARGKATSIQEVDRNGRFALAVIAVDIREATGVNSVTTGKLSLARANAPASDPTDYELVGGAVQVTRGSTALPLTNSKVTVTELTFENLSPPNSMTSVIRVHLRLVSKDVSVVGRAIDKVFETTERVRKNDGYSTN